MKLAANLPILSSAQDIEGVARNVLLMYDQIARAINNPDFGTTAARPKQNLTMGQTYFDTTLGKPIWWRTDTAHWVDATGTNV